MYFWIVVVLTLHTLAFLNSLGNFKQLKENSSTIKSTTTISHMASLLNFTFFRILAYCVYIVLHLAGFVIYYCIPLYCYQNALKIEMGCLARNLTSLKSSKKFHRARNHKSHNLLARGLAHDFLDWAEKWYWPDPPLIAE